MGFNSGFKGLMNNLHDDGKRWGKLRILFPHYFRQQQKAPKTNTADTHFAL